MQFGTWDTIFNMLLMIFWLKIWVGKDRAFFFNPYMAAIGRWMDAVSTFLRPAFFGLSDRIVAAISLAFLLALRGAAAPRAPSAWLLRLGFEIRQVASPSIAVAIAFSFLSFGIFIFKLWAVSLFYLRDRARPSSHSSSALYLVARPYTGLSPALRPAVLIIFGMLLAASLNVAGAIPPGLKMLISGVPAHPLTSGISSVAFGIRCAVSSLGGLVDALTVLQHAVILFVIGSLVSSFTGSGGMMAFCRDGLDMLMGPLRRRPIRIGMLDLTPIVFLFVISLIQGFLYVILERTYLAIT